MRNEHLYVRPRARYHGYVISLVALRKLFAKAFRHSFTDLFVHFINVYREPAVDQLLF